MVHRLALRATLAAVCLAGAVACLVAYVSNVRFTDALETSLHTGDYARALREVRRSDSALNPTAYRDVAISLALIEVGRPLEAERLARRLTRREPDNPQTWISLARVQLTRGEAAAARASWARARRLDPHLRAGLPSPIPIVRPR
jgi:predicted Zn-dependent protease